MQYRSAVKSSPLLYASISVFVKQKLHSVQGLKIKHQVFWQGVWDMAAINDQELPESHDVTATPSSWSYLLFLSSWVSRDACLCPLSPGLKLNKSQVFLTKSLWGLLHLWWLTMLSYYPQPIPYGSGQLFPSKLELFSFLPQCCRVQPADDYPCHSPSPALQGAACWLLPMSH